MFTQKWYGPISQDDFIRLQIVTFSNMIYTNLTFLSSTGGPVQQKKHYKRHLAANNCIIIFYISYMYEIVLLKNDQYK